jgi:hypothetical protein
MDADAVDMSGWSDGLGFYERLIILRTTTRGFPEALTIL